MKLKLRAFTLVELMVVITIITVLSTFVVINLNAARKKARDDRRISDIQLIGNALDQYATTHARVYPLGNPASEDSSTYISTPISAIYEDLKKYINPVPSDPIAQTGYQYYYVYRVDGRKAAVVAMKLETGQCNIASLPAGMSGTLPSTGCYFVSR